MYKRQLLEILAVPISERINVLFGKKVGITVEEIVEMDRRQLGAALPSSGIVIEISDDSTNENASQFYMLEREAASRIVNFVMGIGASQPNPLDEIASVSYTHLDVYKRQCRHRAGIFPEYQRKRLYGVHG